MIINACKLGRPIFQIEVTKENYIQIKSALKEERIKFIDKLKQYQIAGLIGSVTLPRNKYIQKELDDIVKKKKILKKSIEQINKIFR